MSLNLFGAFRKKNKVENNENTEATKIGSVQRFGKQVLQEKCPKCGATIAHECYQRYEIYKNDQSIKKQLMGDSNNIFDSKCPKCGVNAHFAYPFQYIDMDKKLNIFVLPIGHPEEDKFFENIEKYDTKPGFTTRLVADGIALADKINVFEAKLDDRVVELCKILLWGDLSEDDPKYLNAESTMQHFIYSKGNKEAEKVIMYGYELNGKRDTIALRLSDDYYNNIKKNFEPVFHLMEMKKFEEVNSKWGYEAIEVFKQHKKR